MFKSLLLLLATFSLFTFSFSQSKNDVMHLMDGSKEVQIKEVSQNLIKFTYPREETIYSISKHQVEKIVFASGRVELFESPFKKIKGLENAEDVFVTYNFEEVTGLENVGQLFSKATGVTSLSSMYNVKNRAFEKMKLEATMLGANVILIGNSSSRGNTYGNENVPSVSTQTVLFGQAYNSYPLNIEKLKGEIKNKRVHHYLTYNLNRKLISPEMTVATKYDSDRRHIMTEITEVIEDNGKLFIKIKDFKSKTDVLQVIRANETQIVLMEQTNNKIYNYILLTEDSNILKNPSTITRVYN